MAPLVPAPKATASGEAPSHIGVPWPALTGSGCKTAAGLPLKSHGLAAGDAQRRRSRAKVPGRTLPPAPGHGGAERLPPPELVPAHAAPGAAALGAEETRVGPPAVPHGPERQDRHCHRGQQRHREVRGAGAGAPERPHHPGVPEPGAGPGGAGGDPRGHRERGGAAAGAGHGLAGLGARLRQRRAAGGAAPGRAGPQRRCHRAAVRRHPRGLGANVRHQLPGPVPAHEPAAGAAEGLGARPRGDRGFVPAPRRYRRQPLPHRAAPAPRRRRRLQQQQAHGRALQHRAGAAPAAYRGHLQRREPRRGEHQHHAPLQLGCPGALRPHPPLHEVGGTGGPQHHLLRGVGGGRGHHGQVLQQRLRAGAALGGRPRCPPGPGAVGRVGAAHGAQPRPPVLTAVALHGDTVALPGDAPAGVPTAHRGHAGCAAPSTMEPGAAPAVPAPRSAPGCGTAPHPAPSQKEAQPQGSIVPSQSPRRCRRRQHSSFIKGGCHGHRYSQVMSRSRRCFRTLCRKPS